MSIGRSSQIAPDFLVPAETAITPHWEADYRAHSTPHQLSFYAPDLGDATPDAEGENSRHEALAHAMLAHSRVCFINIILPTEVREHISAGLYDY